MVGRAALNQRQDDALERIEAHARRKKGSDDEQVLAAVDNLRGVHGRDENHKLVFRLEAIADLLDAVEEAEGRSSPDPLEVKKVPELRQIADDLGIERTYEKNKPELIAAIREKEEADGEE